MKWNGEVRNNSIITLLCIDNTIYSKGQEFEDVSEVGQILFKLNKACVRRIKHLEENA